MIRAPLIVIMSSVSSAPAWGTHSRGNPLTSSRVTTGLWRFTNGLIRFLLGRMRFRAAILLCSIFISRLFLTPAGTYDSLRRLPLVHDVNSFLLVCV